MASAEHIKGLIRAHLEQDNARFKTIVLQIAANEARQGHVVVAREIKQLSEKLSNTNNIVQINNNPLLEMYLPNDKISELIVSDNQKIKINRILEEFKNRDKLQAYGLSNRRKILLEGAPGTGKTFTASVIASELRIPLFVVQMDKIVTKFMGETSAKLRLVFEDIKKTMGVYFFDEFDAIGANRSLDNEVGEARRILNSFLQFIEQDDSNSIIIAATNNHKLLDQALFRRFDDVIHYAMPEEDEIRVIFEKKLIKKYYIGNINTSLIDAAKGLSQSEIISACDDCFKSAILYNKQFNEADLIAVMKDKGLYSRIMEA
ncbi:AAA family ATPase [Veillonella sp. AS16]|uniref:AAA family ATPase n=1 Tax=Veillonella sp. AS16 TaxID=936589 RepID=UPI0003E2B5FD|nr:ATP-binding protein [Veillonella sp. AS16]ETS92713.1 ATPase, AAA family [Veillonella sp. AS16]